MEAAVAAVVVIYVVLDAGVDTIGVFVDLLLFFVALPMFLLLCRGGSYCRCFRDCCCWY